jgi:hypothetical protein
VKRNEQRDLASLSRISDARSAVLMAQLDKIKAELRQATDQLDNAKLQQSELLQAISLAWQRRAAALAEARDAARVQQIDHAVMGLRARLTVVDREVQSKANNVDKLNLHKAGVIRTLSREDVKSSFISSRLVRAQPDIVSERVDG